MANQVLIATHGSFSKGILESLKMIFGKVDNIKIIEAYKDKAVDYNLEIKKNVEDFDYERGKLIVLTDLNCGSVNNEFMKYLNEYPFWLITGINLALVLEILINKDFIDEEKIRSIITESKRNIVFCNDEIKKNVQIEDF